MRRNFYLELDALWTVSEPGARGGLAFNEFTRGQVSYVHRGAPGFAVPGMESVTGAGASRNDSTTIVLLS